MKNKMKDHPNRQELISAARTGGEKFSKHLKDCDWCRTFFELSQKYQVAGELQLEDAPQNWVAQAVALAEKETITGKLKSLVATLTFDSWSMPLPAGVRGEGLLQERRIRFEIQDKKLDLRAEHRRNRWDFVARVTDSEGRHVECTLLAGKKELTADKDGFYQWSSVRPPVKFSILTKEGELKTPELSWKSSPAE